MRKVTIQASSDIALVKYWGKKDDVLRLPENGSVSMILDGLDTVTTVEFDATLESDRVSIDGAMDDQEVRRVVEHLDRIRKLADSSLHAHVESRNTFPRGTGLSSSGSGFAALTIAATRALDLQLSERELSILARQGSGTACRCVCGGYVEWKDAEVSDASYSQTIFPADHWDIRDVVAVVDRGKKSTSSTKGHESAKTCVFFQSRQERITEKILDVKRAIADRDFLRFGDIVERESYEFHSILLTSVPPLLMWYPGTVEVLHAVVAMRKEGIPAYATINTGFNVHVLTLPEYEEDVERRLLECALVQSTLHARVGNGPREL